MPYEGLGRRHAAVATKAVNHGDPTIENGFPGVAFKQQQLGAFVDPTSTAARQIAVGESFVIQFGGVHEVAGALIPGGVAAAPVGTPIYITDADNTLVLAAGAGISKFGRVESVDTTRSVVHVNAEARDTF